MRILRIKLIVIVLAIFLFMFFLIFVFYGLAIGKHKILAGVVSQVNYNNLEQNKIYSQQPNVEVKTVQTPEQTYIKLRDYLEAGQVNEILSLFSDKYKNEYKDIFDKAKQAGKLAELYNKLEEKISKDEENCYPTKCSYVMVKSKTIIDFVKDSRGVWLIEAL